MAEYILKDRHGNSRTFDKETFYVRGVDGELMPFTHGTGNPVLQPLTITENGTYTAPEGVDGYNPVTVDVPAPEVNLQDKTITENGEYTADEGYDGLGKVLVQLASSGGGSVKIATGTIDTEQSTIFTVNHNLGVVPDFVYVKNKSTSNGYSYCAYGISQKLADLLGGFFVHNLYLAYSSNRFSALGSFTGIEDANGRGIRNATETKFDAYAASSAKYSDGSTWVAIGGLVPSTE